MHESQDESHYIVGCAHRRYLENVSHTQRVVTETFGDFWLMQAMQFMSHGSFQRFSAVINGKSLSWAPLFQLQIPGLLCPKVYTKPANAVHHLKQKLGRNFAPMNHAHHRCVHHAYPYLIIIDPPVRPAISHIFSLVWASHRQ